MKVADIKNVAGIGGGVIGGSWAVLFAMKGLNVKLYDINDDCLANDKKTIVSNLEFLTENGTIEDKDAVLARIQFTTSMEEAVKMLSLFRNPVLKDFRSNTACLLKSKSMRRLMQS